MIDSENLITLVQANPEIWDQKDTHYNNKNLKLKTWNTISSKLCVTVEVAKSKWTTLRDLFRRELKKTVKIARETGDPDAHKPCWRHFDSMLFLKDQIIKDEDLSYSEDAYTFYPQTILDDGDSSKFKDDFDDHSTPNSTPSHLEVAILPETMAKRNNEYCEQNYSPDYRPHKRQRHHHARSLVKEEYETSPYSDMDDDYHFIMSILPAMRRMRSENKNMFRMKVLELIVEEEKLCAS